MRTRRFIITAAAGAATVATLAPAAAHAAPPGVCQLSAHLQLANGIYSADASTVQCGGMINGQPVRGGGFLQAWGTYGETGCALSWRDNFFYARIPEAIEFFGPTYIDTEGGYTLAGSGQVMQLTGSGDNDGEPFVESGTAQFAPDQSGCALHSGTLTETVAITDGGSGNPAAAAAAGRYARSSDGDSGIPAGASSTGPATVSHHTVIRRKHSFSRRKRHHRSHKAHRTARRQRH